MPYVEPKLNLASRVHHTFRTALSNVALLPHIPDLALTHCHKLKSWLKTGESAPSRVPQAARILQVRTFLTSCPSTWTVVR